MMDVFEYVVGGEVGGVDVSALIDPDYLGNVGELLKRFAFCYGLIG